MKTSTEIKELNVPVPCASGRVDRWFLTTECERYAEPIAEKFSISVAAFLTRFSHGDFRNPFKKVDENRPPASFTVQGIPDNLRRRLERAAAIDKVSVSQFCWSAIASWLNTSESENVYDDEHNVVGSAQMLNGFCDVTFPATGRVLPGRR